MADMKLDQADYPLTVIAVDVEGVECYRTQLDWSGVGHNTLDNVPSSDLDFRRPRWASYEVIDASGKVVDSGSNPHKDDEVERVEGADDRTGDKMRQEDAPATKKADAKGKEQEDVGANDSRPSAEPATRKADAKGK
jgi:hypothetical protein